MVSRNGHFPQERSDCGGTQNKVLKLHIRVRAGIDAVHKAGLRCGIDLVEEGESRVIFECGEERRGERKGLPEQKFAAGEKGFHAVGAASRTDYGSLLAEQAAAGRQRKILAGEFLSLAVQHVDVKETRERLAVLERDREALHGLGRRSNQAEPAVTAHAAQLMRPEDRVALTL